MSNGVMTAHCYAKVVASHMFAVVTKGTGGYDKRAHTAGMPVQAGGILLRLLAAGVSNTQINRLPGWCSTSVRTGTHEATGDRC